MLLREQDGGVLAIGQQSHAWLSGQLARAWGNRRFGSVEPWEEVCLAADQHDLGWAERDRAPLWNRDTGLPRSFMEMPLEEHLRIWTQGPPRLLTQTAYAALLVSMHGWRLYERRDLDRASPEDAAAIRAFLAEQRVWQRELMEQLEPDEELLERNSRLIWTWDYLSLALCLGWNPATAQGAPTADGQVYIELTTTPSGSTAVDPWPFGADMLRVRCQGRRLTAADDERALREQLGRAPWETLELDLIPR